MYDNKLSINKLSDYNLGGKWISGKLEEFF